MARLNTRLESEGAEFLVLGNLLLERIPTYKTYTNMPGYDLVATNPEAKLSTRIQVKSRWKTNADAFPISSFDCDFVVFCRLNRGSALGQGKVKEPEYFVFPVKDLPREVIDKVEKSTGWKKLYLRDIPNLESYRNHWDLIRRELNLPQPNSTV